MENWRSILDGDHPASYNMAADAYLLHAADTDDGVPVVRVYGWDRPSITIGYHQSPERAVNTDKLGETPVVRRITGGRALLHDDNELTYSVSGNFRNYPRLGHNLHETYYLISRAIVDFYNNLGVPAQISRRDQPVSLRPNDNLQAGCYAAISRHEIIVEGQKIAAGSQRRTQKSLIQHGAVKISPSKPHPAIAGSPQYVDDKYLSRIVWGRGELIDGLVKAFIDTFNISLILIPFTRVEKADIMGILPRFENLNSR
jgi:lipoate-protein ligase A